MSRFQLIDSGGRRKTGVFSRPGQEQETLGDYQSRVHNLSRSFRKQRGAAAVEFAVVAPIFMLLLFGMIEYGRMVMVQQMLTNATREGARRAVLDGISDQDVKDSVIDYCSSANIKVQSDDVLVNPSPTAAKYGDPITVQVRIPFSRVSWLSSPWFLGSTNMSATSVMRRESVQ